MNIFISFCSLLFVNHIYGIKIDETEFAGIGSMSDKDPTVIYKSSGWFQDDMCFSKSSKNCWNPQGISSYNDYITHSFYQAGDCGKKCTGSTNSDGSIRYFSSISIQRMSSGKYMVILINTFPEECHAGDHVFTKIDDQYYFIVACEQGNSDNYLAIFSENDIEFFEDGVVESHKKFKYIVYKNIIKIYQPDGMQWDYISRYQGEDNNYIIGNYGKTSTSSKLLMKKININPSNNWSMTELISYKVASKKAKTVQGATMVKSNDGTEYMMLSTNRYIRRCDISLSGDTIGPCYKQCKLPYCTTGSGKLGNKLALQGGETDDDGSYFVATEWSNCVDDRQGFPFYKIRNMAELTDHDESCLNYPDNKLNAPQAIADINNELISNSDESTYLVSPYADVYLGVIIFLTILLLVNTYFVCKQCKNK